MTDLTLRPATADDLRGVADLHVRSRDAAVPAMPPSVHPPEDARRWVGGWDLDEQSVWVAEGDRLLGYARHTEGWLDDLYVDPDAQGSGIGSHLLDLVKSQRPGGFCLWVFESNAPARGFYARHGLVELERTDGAGNEEKQPDIRMAWPGDEPLTFYRGLIDEVDGELGDVLNRRAALTRAVQAHKTAPGRDPDRERAIAEAMATRAPTLGADRLARIVHTVITESLDASG